MSLEGGHPPVELHLFRCYLLDGDTGRGWGAVGSRIIPSSHPTPPLLYQGGGQMQGCYPFLCPPLLLFAAGSWSGATLPSGTGCRCNSVTCLGNFGGRLWIQRPTSSPPISRSCDSACTLVAYAYPYGVWRRKPPPMTSTLVGGAISACAFRGSVLYFIIFFIIIININHNVL